MSSQLLARIDSPAPKKILACDGGGILGLISVEILARIEADLRAKLGKPDLIHTIRGVGYMLKDVAA